jgi:hypothetical protein
MGDFNIDENRNSDLINLMKMYGLIKISNYEDTRVTRGSSTLIDHIYVSQARDICKSGVIPIGISDHHLVYAVRGRIK